MVVMSKKKLSAAILGCGSRGANFGTLMKERDEKFEVSAVCDTDEKQLEKVKALLNVSDELLFCSEEDFFEKKRADILVIATPDKLHVKQCIRAMKLGYDVLLEKPVSDSAEEIEELLAVQKETGRMVAVCHELRYAPAFEKISELLNAGVIGKLLVIDATERLVYWHQAQAYVRLQSQYSDLAYPTILAKCSHDFDLIQHYAESRCKTVSSVGDLSFFRKENAPEGATEFCLDCPHMNTCPYSAKRIYIDGFEAAGCPEWIWPYNKVSLIKPTAVEDLYEGIKTKCFGKCAFLCGVEKDEHVVDHQLVQMEFENGVVATLKMIFAGAAGRRYNLLGTHGEILMDERCDTIEVFRYGEEKETIKIKNLVEAGYSHGGGDVRLIENLYSVLAEGKENRTTLYESAESHLMGIAAEKSRLSGGMSVNVHTKERK